MTNEANETTPGILAAWCPDGWRRDPLNGQPVMPCLGKLLFPCEPDEVPTSAEMRRQCCEAGLEGVVMDLVFVVLSSAATAKLNHNKCMDLLDERAVSRAVDEALRRRGTVRIVRESNGWR